jgi:AAA family ATP:ADP antiporter
MAVGPLLTDPSSPLPPRSLANDVCTVDEAKSVYPMMGIAANVALVVAGAFIKFANSSIAAGSQLLSLRVLVGTIMATTALMFLAKSFVDSRIIAPQRAVEAAAIAEGAFEASGTKKPGKKKKAKGSIGESIEVLRNSPKILNLALLVMSYGVGHRLFEFAWKGQLRTLHSSVVGYQSVLADVATYTGMTTIALMLTSRFVFQHLGWGVAAAATPVIMMITGAAFFATSVAAQQGLLPATMDPAVVAGLGVAAGVVTQVRSHSCLCCMESI